MCYCKCFHFQANDGRVSGMMKSLQNVFKHVTILEFAPWLRYVAPSISGHPYQVEYTTRLKKMMNEVISEHEENGQDYEDEEGKSKVSVQKDL